MADCLIELGLTDFAAATENIGLSSRLADMEEEFTVFAPTNDAINGQFLGLLTVTSHILNEIVRNSELRSGAVLRPLNEDTLLHVTDVHTYTWELGFNEVSSIAIDDYMVHTSGLCL